MDEHAQADADPVDREPHALDPASTAPAPVKVARFWPVVSGGVALALVVVLAFVIFYRERDKPFGFEVEYMSGLAANRADWLTTPALVFNAIGGGLLSTFAVPAVIIGGLLLFRRPWGAAYYLAATIASATVTRVIKVMVARPRPEEILVQPDFGSFPSGHSANAAVTAAALGLIFLRTWVWVTGAIYTLLMMLSRTYLGAHWISDTIGGLLVGVGVAVIIWAPFANKLYREHRMPHPPIWVRARHPSEAASAPAGAPDRSPEDSASRGG
ncbi:undecaprenyl-diphosphatase [Agromyces sp. 3263]|uniref:phosphatase PAP2 family protein n=1 Tax=Agromyces sp. 3263 TaxID=2817750 RepID=UPI00285E9DCD|nr:phosphatase PAP2 family protein [Agromyces sp. 3263]MDR6905911.1 undecaprenyl-diphosphatase [Agromyces sp. 3263]